MTLHWWMHWFWVTTQFLVILGSPVPSSTTEPRVDQTQDRGAAEPPASSGVASVDAEGHFRYPSRQNFRVAKAIGLYSQTNAAVILDRQVTTIDAPMERPGTTVSPVVESSTGAFVMVESPRGSSASNVSVDPTGSSTYQRPTESVERIRAPLAKKDSKITRILTASKSGRSKYSQEEKVLEAGRNSSVEEAEDLTVLPLQEEAPKLRLVLNKTRPLSSLLSSSSSLSASAGQTGTRTFNRSADDDVEISDEDFAKTRLFATAASILEVGVSESTRLSRARSAFPKDFQRDQVQGEDRPLDYNDSSLANGSEGAGTSTSAVDIAAITGSCLATIVLLSTMGSLGFIMYRRRYLNPPQTLNSDKCSNPDSSGYIDDSTIRDNSEEMYSLDNDSFLNSLEAMTIQNYWTDSVKHTKL